MNSKALESTTGLTVRRDYIFEIRRVLLLVLPVLLMLSSNGTASPTLGAHVLAFYTCENTNGNLVAPAIATQSSGSTILAWVGVGHINSFSGADPLDSYGNSYGMVGAINTYAPDFPSSGAALFAVPLAAGGSGEIITKPMPFNDEVTLAVVEVKNGGVIQDAEFNRVPGPPQTSLNVTTTGPATLVAIWAGYSGGASVTAVPNNSFTTIDSQLLSYCEVEAVVATKDVASAGTYNVTWTATPTQEALLWLIAVQDVTSSPPVLQAQVFGGNVVISWPSLAAGYSLETTSDLSASNSWTPVTNAPAIIDFQNTITNATAQPSQYYRLQKQ